MSADTITSNEMKFILQMMQAIQKVKLECDLWATGTIQIHSNVHGKQVGYIEVDSEDTIFCSYFPIDIDEVQNDN